MIDSNTENNLETKISSTKEETEDNIKDLFSNDNNYINFTENKVEDKKEEKENIDIYDFNKSTISDADKKLENKIKDLEAKLDNKLDMLNFGTTTNIINNNDFNIKKEEKPKEE